MLLASVRARPAASALPSAAAADIARQLWACRPRHNSLGTLLSPWQRPIPVVSMFCAKSTRCFSQDSVGAATLTVILGQLFSVFAWPWPSPWRIRTDPGLALLAALTLPLVGVLLVVLLGAVVLDTAGAPFGPTMAAICSLVISVGAVLVALIEPPLPEAFDSRSLTPLLLLCAAACAWWWSDYLIRVDHNDSNPRRGSLQDQLLPSSSHEPGKQNSDDTDPSPAVSVPASAIKAQLVLRRPSLFDLLVKVSSNAASMPSQKHSRGRQEGAITALWFAKGLLDSLPGVAVRQFVLQEVEASPAVQAVIFSVLGVLPWNLKFFAAFVSDCCPVCGYRRLPYMVFGLCGQAICWCLLAALPATEAGTAALYCAQIICCMVMCVMLDTMTVDAMNKYEVGDEKGLLQSSTWLWGTVGGLIGGLLGGSESLFEPSHAAPLQLTIAADMQMGTRILACVHLSSNVLLSRRCSSPRIADLCVPVRSKYQGSAVDAWSWFRKAG
eukprot:SAG31_NODE_1763_length_7322_cov_21.697633_10_plen_497_part_00